MPNGRNSHGPAGPANSANHPGSLLEQDPAGRVDVLAVRCARAVVGRMERNLGGAQLWDKGLGGVVETAIRENLPSNIVTLTDVARNIGLLPKKGRRRST